MISITLPHGAAMQPGTAATEHEEGEMVAALYSGNELKFKKLYQRYSPALMGIITRIIKSGEVSEDVLQETFIKIWKSKMSYDPARGRLFTWMASTARHAAIDQLKSRAQSNSDKNLDIGAHYAELERTYQVAPNPDSIGVKVLTDKLLPGEKELLHLIYFEGYTHTQAAEQLDIPLGTVKTRLRKAVCTIRKYF